MSSGMTESPSAPSEPVAVTSSLEPAVATAASGEGLTIGLGSSTLSSLVSAGAGVALSGGVNNWRDLYYKLIGTYRGWCSPEGGVRSWRDLFYMHGGQGGYRS